jgi:exonuclease SbcD
MKFIHTSDWHIGKIVNQVYMTEDQEHILNGLVALIEAERPDALVIAGDIYDRAVPPVEAVELVDRIMTKILLELNVPILAIAGNHDSPDRVGFASSIVKDRGLHIEGRMRETIRKVVLSDEHGPVNFYLLPYAQPAVLRDMFSEAAIEDHNTAMKAMIAKIKAEYKPDERNVIVAHAFVRGSVDPELSESEKPLSLGGTDYVSMEHFDGFTYTALGHLHGPQKVGSDRVRYAGSLLKYSFSEATQKKSATIIQIDGQGQVGVELREIAPRRDMRKIKGELKALLDPSVYSGTPVEDYLHVTLTDDGEVLDPMNKLRSVYPNVLGLDFEAKMRKNGPAKTAAGEGYKTKSKLELFEDFYTSITSRDFSAQRKSVLGKVVAGVEAEDRGEAL